LFFAVVANIAAFVTIIIKLLGSSTYQATCEKPLLAATAVCLASFAVEFCIAIAFFVRVASYEPVVESGSEDAAEFASLSQLPRDDARVVWFRTSHFWMYDIGMCLSMTFVLFSFAWSIVTLVWGAGSVASAAGQSLASTAYSAGVALIILTVLSIVLALGGLTKQFCALPGSTLYRCCCCCCIWCCCEPEHNSYDAAHAQVQQRPQQLPVQQPRPAPSAAQVIVNSIGSAVASAIFSPPPNPNADSAASRRQNDVVVLVPPPVQPRPSAGPSYQVMWSCVACTLHNNDSASFCTACGTPKPAAVVAEPGSQSYAVPVAVAPPPVVIPSAASAAPASREPQTLAQKGAAILDSGVQSLTSWLSKK
jgi:hypothetical protein